MNFLMMKIGQFKQKENIKISKKKNQYNQKENINLKMMKDQLEAREHMIILMINLLEVKGIMDIKTMTDL